MAPKKKTASSPSPTKTVSGLKKKKDQVAENAASAAIQHLLKTRMIFIGSQ